MKSILEFLTKQKILNDLFKYHPSTKEELKEAIKKEIANQGNEADLNCINTSNIEDMSSLFWGTRFDGDISGWDVSGVINMSRMFNDSCYTGKHGGISNWKPVKVENMDYMFFKSNFTGDISNWEVLKSCSMSSIFSMSPLENTPPIWYKK